MQGISTPPARKVHSFTDLLAWQEAHKLVVALYAETRKFPHDEQFGLVSQLRRAAVSITSNIAEGFSRQSKKEKTQFYCISMGSLREVQNQLLIARDVGLMRKDDAESLAENTVLISKLLSGLIKKLSP